mmetsp:Transcript_22477/g.33631  ORF Transcript_22477/g.33631 Transcript_22477/m.33631 type:complete len:326 (-) Transcript_22477:300-1277(-)
MNTTLFLLIITLLNLSSHFRLASSKLHPKQSTVFDDSLMTGPFDFFESASFLFVFLLFNASASSSARALRAIFDIFGPKRVPLFLVCAVFGSFGLKDFGASASSVSFIVIGMPRTVTSTRLPPVLTTFASAPFKAPFLQTMRVSPGLISGFTLISASGTTSAKFSASTAAACFFLRKTLGIFSASVNTSLLTYLISSQLFATNFLEGSDLSFPRISSNILSFSSSFLPNFSASFLLAKISSLSNFSRCFFICNSSSSSSLRFLTSSSACLSITAFWSSISRIKSPICLVSESRSSVARSITFCGMLRRSATDRANDSPTTPGKSL